MLEILRNTPHWVYTTFTVVFYFGLSSCFEGRSRIRHLVSIPAAIVLLSLATVGYQNGPDIRAFGGWSLGALTATALTFWFTRATAHGLRRDGEEMIIPGDVSVLLVGFAAFAVKYWFGYASAIEAGWTLRPSFYIWDTFVSGAIAGFFAGRGLAHFAAARQLGSTPGSQVRHENG